MQKRPLGNSDLMITPLGIGTWAIGGPGYQWGWGPQDDQQSSAAIHAALDAGINWIDTAAVYGLGHSEEIVARILKSSPNKPFVFTKAERVWNKMGEVGGCLKAESIRREAEASLRRLKVDMIDLYQVHWPDPDEDIEEGWTEMARLQQEGKVRYIGVSNFNVSQMKRAQAITPITSLQPPYSMLSREVEKDILPYCRDQNIGVIVYSPMKSGLLTGAMTQERVLSLPENDWRRSSPDFQEPRLSSTLRLVEELRKIGNRHGRTPGEVAIAWTLANPAVTGAIVGIRRPEQVAGVAEAGDFRLSEDEMQEIEIALERESQVFA
jgi:aryl-alcohol dehydrogenase-like predicted oxidoreductase